MRMKHGKTAGPGDEKAAGRDPYHHGALRQALLDVAEIILAERGVEGFTLREAARRAGVSPAAPAHHFGSVAGLLTEVALLGFEELTRHLREGRSRGGDDPFARLREQGVGYVTFALAYPARFQLMFRKDRLLWGDGRLQAAGRAAYAELEGAVRDCLALPPGQPLDRRALASVLGAWSLVHGFSHLALDGKFDGMAGPDGLSGLVGGLLPEVLRNFLPSLGSDGSQS